MDGITIKLSPNDDEWLAVCDEVLVYGVGLTQVKAIEDLMSMMEDKYEDYVRSEEQLADHLKLELAELRRVFELA